MFGKNVRKESDTLIHIVNKVCTTQIHKHSVRLSYTNVILVMNIGYMNIGYTQLSKYIVSAKINS